MQCNIMRCDNQYINFVSKKPKNNKTKTKKRKVRTVIIYILSVLLNNDIIIEVDNLRSIFSASRHNIVFGSNMKYYIHYVVLSCFIIILIISIFISINKTIYHNTSCKGN